MSAGGTQTEKLVSRNKACRKLNISDETIRRWVAEGKIVEQKEPAGVYFRCFYSASEIARIKELRAANVPLPVVVVGD